MWTGVCGLVYNSINADFFFFFLFFLSALYRFTFLGRVGTVEYFIDMDIVGSFSLYASGAVKTQSFVWKFVLLLLFLCAV